MKKVRITLALSIVLVACAALKPTDTKEPVTSKDEAAAIVETKAPATIPVTTAIEDEKWTAPAEADAVKNPTKATEESIADGLLVYKKNCRSCHGKLGNGKGVGAADCTIPPADFTLESFAKQTDGAIFWKINKGKGDMKSYKGELDEEELWNVINYMRTFSKKAE